MSQPTPTAPPDWNTNEGKKSIVRMLIKHLNANLPERKLCLDYEYGKTMTETVTRAKLPAGAKVVFLPEGDNLNGEEPLHPGGEPETAQARMLGGRIQYNAGSSLIITLPPADLEDPKEEKILHYACSYIIW